MPRLLRNSTIATALVSVALSLATTLADDRPRRPPSATTTTAAAAATKALPAPLKPSNTAVPGVGNFAKISDALYRGDQPTRQGFRNLAKLGIRTVVNLRTFHSDRDELAGTRLRYAHIHTQAWHVEDEDIARFLKIVRDPKNQPVFVHCQQGADRTGLLVGAYRVVDQGWTPEQAAEELHAFGHNTVWINIVPALRRLDPKAINAQVERTRMPRIDTIE